MPDDINAIADESPVRMLDASAAAAVVAKVDTVKREGNTLGGICEVVCDGAPVGLGAHVTWERKLDGRIAQAILADGTKLGNAPGEAGRGRGEAEY